MIRQDPPGRSGFTLIEVIGALLIFSAGILMMLSVTRGLSQSLEHSAINSLIAAEGQERLDSLGAVSFSSLAVGTDVDTLTLRGIAYQRTQAVTLYSPLVKRVVVTIEPASGDAGPTFSATSYLADAW